MKLGLFRVCMLWLLLVAVPLQGLAAVAGGCCIRARTQSMIVVPGDGEARLSSKMPCQDMDDMQMVEDDSTGEPSQVHSKKTGSCKPCAACGIGAGAPPSVHSAKIQSFKSDSPVVTPPSTFGSYIPAGLERPPKYLFVIL